MIHSHNGTRVHIEQAVPALTRMVNGQVGHARMDRVFNHNGFTTHFDVAIVSPLLQQPRHSLQQPAPAQVSWPRELRRSNLTDIHTSTLSRLSCRPLDAPWTPSQKVHQQPHAGCRQFTTYHPRGLVSHPECPPQRHLQTTTHSHSHVTLGSYFPWLPCSFVFSPFCSCLPRPSSRLSCSRAFLTWTSSWLPRGAGLPWTFLPMLSKTGLIPNPTFWLMIPDTLSGSELRPWSGRSSFPFVLLLPARLLKVHLDLNDPGSSLVWPAR